MIINDKNYCSGCMYVIENESGICDCGFDEKKYKLEPNCLPIGTVLHDSFVVGKMIGKGGFGITYIGLDTTLEKRVAIKEFYLHGYASRYSQSSTDIVPISENYTSFYENNKKKYLDEARILARFSNIQGIVTVNSFFEENNTAYIIMDYIDGITLKEYLKKYGPISSEKAFSLLKNVINALEKIHKKNVYHRDIKPSNIMITPEEEAFLLDFGAAREIQDSDETITIIKTPGYAPFEQINYHGNQGPWTDIYELCATLYHCVTGKAPIDSNKRMELDDLVEPYKINSRCSKHDSEIIMKGLSLKPDDRYQSIEQLKSAISVADNAKDNKDSLTDENSSEEYTILAASNHNEDSSIIDEFTIDSNSYEDNDKSSEVHTNIHVLNKKWALIAFICCLFIAIAAFIYKYNKPVTYASYPESEVAESLESNDEKTIAENVATFNLEDVAVEETEPIPEEENEKVENPSEEATEDTENLSKEVIEEGESLSEKVIEDTESSADELIEETDNLPEEVIEEEHPLEEAEETESPSEEGAEETESLSDEKIEDVEIAPKEENTVFFNPFDGLVLEYSGEDGKGTVTVKSTIYDGIKYDFSKDSNLINGEEIKIGISYDEATCKEKNGGLPSLREKVYVVQGLTAPNPFDPFDKLVLSFLGTNGKGTADITSGKYEGIIYEISKTSALSNGNTVEITINYDEDECKKANNRKLPSSLNKIYTVSGLEEVKKISPINNLREVDVFKNFKIEFSGANGNGKAEIINNNKYQDLDFRLSKKDKLSNNDEIIVTLKYSSNKEKFIEKNGIKPVSETKKYKVSGLIEIKENTLSKETLEDIFEKYNDYYKDHYNSSNSYLVLEFLNNDDIPEMLVQYDGTVDVFEYVDGKVCAIAAFRENINKFLYSPNDEKIILSGYTDFGWTYVYSLNTNKVGFLEGVHTNSSGSYFDADSEGKATGYISALDYANFMERNKDDNYLVYRMSNSKKFQDAEDAYNYLVGVSTSRKAFTLKGSDVAKLPVLNANATSVLDVHSTDNMTYIPENMIDGNVKTTWSEGEDGLGEGVSFTIKLDGNHQISSIKIYNGFLKTKRRYAINGKVSKVKLDYNNSQTQEEKIGVMNLAEKEVAFANNELNPTIILAPEDCITDEITITILDAVAGSKYEDVGISEIEIFGR